MFTRWQLKSSFVTLKAHYIMGLLFSNPLYCTSLHFVRQTKFLILMTRGLMERIVIFLDTISYLGILPNKKWYHDQALNQNIVLWLVPLQIFSGLVYCSLSYIYLLQHLQHSYVITLLLFVLPRILSFILGWNTLNFISIHQQLLIEHVTSFDSSTCRHPY